MMLENTHLAPNFWRAPTDNDFGASLQNKYRVWKKPELKLTSFSKNLINGLVQVKANYDIPSVSAKLILSYEINNKGEIKVTQEMMADKSVSVPNMFRFGMQMQMPKNDDQIKYYGRGPFENYSDRKSSSFIGLYQQTVEEQFYPYIRPQENGTKSDVRWWCQTDAGGRGLKFYSDTSFSISALHYSIESLDAASEKQQEHSELVPEVPYTNICIDKVQMGLGCINSWGDLPLEPYRLHYGSYKFSFIMKPVMHKL